MLHQLYKTTDFSSPNHHPLLDPSQSPTSFKRKGITYPSGPLDVFDPFTPDQLRSLFDEQYAAAELEARELARYSLLSAKSLQITLEQYQQVFFYEQLAYDKTAILNYSQHSQRTQSVVSGLSSPTVTSPVRTSQDRNQYKVSRQAIRDMVGFSFRPIPGWSQDQQPVYLQWQEEFLAAKEDVVCINGSRQMGKSKAISQLLSEESFEVGGDLGVFAFQQDTTDVIRTYFRDIVDTINLAFDTPVFEENKQKNFFRNILTGTRIHFRTLADSGSRVRGLTLRISVVDEAQEIDVQTIEAAVLPTMTATKGRLYLLGTPGPERDRFMYHTILEINQGRTYNQPGFPTAKVMNVDVDHNPLVEPKRRQYIMANRDRADIQREYFCVWGAGQDRLFEPQIILSQSPVFKEDTVVFAIDPARKHDRSAFAAMVCGNGRIELILSGEVPLSHKTDWNLQANYLLDTINALKKQYPKLHTVMDISGVGDGASQIFRNHGINIDMSVRYTAGDQESDSFDGTRVGKIRLINYTLDAMTSKIFQVVKAQNAMFLNELDTIEAAKSKQGNIKMETHGFDDITNAVMIGIYFCMRRGLHTRNMRTPSNLSSSENIWLRENETYGRNPKAEYARTKIASIW